MARLEAGIDYAQMSAAMIYGLPMGADGPAAQTQEIRREVSLSFPALARYVRTASTQGDGLLIWLS